MVPTAATLERSLEIDSCTGLPRVRQSAHPSRLQTVLAQQGRIVQAQPFGETSPTSQTEIKHLKRDGSGGLAFGLPRWRLRARATC